ncbi:MAG: 30S ribosomal protein S11 [Bacteroidota bacterium]
MAKPQQRAKKRKVVVDQAGQAHIKATYNNVIISMTNGGGQVIAWSSAGKMGFKGSKKNTPYAAQISAADCAKAAYELGLRQIEVYVKGAGVGRDAAIRTLQDNGLEVMVIKDITPIPHNGCRPPKRRHP